MSLWEKTKKKKVVEEEEDEEETEESEEDETDDLDMKEILELPKDKLIKEIMKNSNDNDWNILAIMLWKLKNEVN